MDGFVWETAALIALTIVNGNLTIHLEDGSVNTFRSTTIEPNVTSDPGGALTLSTDTPCSYNASDKYVKLTTGPVALVGDATITSTVRTPLTAQTAVITVYLDKR